MSASRTPTSWPSAASAAARLTASDDLPTPPLPDATAITRVVAGSCTPFGSAPPRSLVVSAARSSGVITSKCRRDRGDARQRPDVTGDLLLEARAQRAAGDGERDRDGDVGAVDLDLADHVELGDRLPQLRVDDERERSEDLVASRHGRRLDDCQQLIGVTERRRSGDGGARPRVCDALGMSGLRPSLGCLGAALRGRAARRSDECAEPDRAARVAVGARADIRADAGLRGRVGSGQWRRGARDRGQRESLRPPAHPTSSMPCGRERRAELAVALRRPPGGPAGALHVRLSTGDVLDAG